jgi:hypothetical protein
MRVSLKIAKHGLAGLRIVSRFMRDSKMVLTDAAVIEKSEIAK